MYVYIIVADKFFVQVWNLIIYELWCVCVCVWLTLTVWTMDKSRTTENYFRIIVIV